MPRNDRLWTPAERKILDRLRSPLDVQEFLNAIPYSSDSFLRSARSVMRDRKGHCCDGAFFAAAAMRRLGHPPLLVDLRAVRDDDHVLVVFRHQGFWGAVAKSNFVGLRYREPIFRNLRELVLSYFEDYFNEHGEKTLRSYSVPVDLSRWDRLEWMTRDENLEEVSSRLDTARHISVANPRQIRELAAVDARSLKAGMVGTVKAGLYKGG
jgi:hypothetical protein